MKSKTGWISDTTAFIRDGYDGLISKETIITGFGPGIVGTDAVVAG